MRENRGGYGLLHTAYQPIVCAPIVIQPHIEFGQGVITHCSVPRIIPCRNLKCRYLLQQDLTVQIPFTCEAQVETGMPYIQCCPPAYTL